jgi:predicted nuclease with TOPRIM domain
MGQKGRFFMPTQEEKITVLEENITILLGIASGQERDIKSIQVGVMSLDRRFDALEGRLYGMDHRLSTLEKRFDTLEQSVSSRFDTLEQSVSVRLEEQDKKLDQILLLLNTYIPKPGQET